MDVLRQGMADDGLDRRKPGATGDENDRPFGFLAQKKRPERAAKAQ